MAMSMEDIIDKGVVTDKEPLVICSRSKLKAICKELGITNECRVSNEYSSLVNFDRLISRANEMNDTDTVEKLSNQVTHLIESWKEDEAVTSI